jgi:hypothetical protein
MIPYQLQSKPLKTPNYRRGSVFELSTVYAQITQQMQDMSMLEDGYFNDLYRFGGRTILTAIFNLAEKILKIDF